jgi:hypothetical protein
LIAAPCFRVGEYRLRHSIEAHASPKVTFEIDRDQARDFLWTWRELFLSALRSRGDRRRAIGTQLSLIVGQALPTGVAVLGSWAKLLHIGRASRSNSAVTVTLTTPLISGGALLRNRHLGHAKEQRGASSEDELYHDDSTRLMRSRRAFRQSAVDAAINVFP